MSIFKSIGSSLNKAFSPVSKAVSSGYKTISNGVKRSGLDRQVLNFAGDSLKQGISDGLSAEFGPEAGYASKYVMDKYGGKVTGAIGRKIRGRGSYYSGKKKSPKKRKYKRKMGRYRGRGAYSSATDSLEGRTKSPSLINFLAEGAKRSTASAYKPVNVNNQKSAVSAVTRGCFIGVDSSSGDLKSPSLVDPIHVNFKRKGMLNQEFMAARDKAVTQDRDGLRSLYSKRTRFY